MALTEQEKLIVEFGKAQGKRPDEVMTALARFRASSAPPTTPTAPVKPQQPSILSRIANTVVDTIGARPIVDTYGTALAKIGKNDQEKNILDAEAPSLREVAGSALKTGSLLLPGASAGSSLLRVGTAGALGGYAYDVGENIQEGAGSPSEVLKPGIGTAIGAVAAPAAQIGVNTIVNGASRGAKATKTVISDTAQTLSNKVSEHSIAGGVKQMGEETVDRMPRFVGRVSEGIQEAFQRSERIKTAAPVIQKAIKSGLDDRIIRTVEQADEPTVKAFRQIVDLAQDTGTTIKPKVRPESIAGKAAADQYKLIEKQKRTVGQSIGDAVKSLTQKNVKADMGVSFYQIDEVLKDNGIAVQNGRLLFSGKFTPSERAKIQEVYTLAHEAGDVLTPSQVYDMDHLFSKLQRESRMEGIGDLRINVEGQDMSLFRVIRDVYSNQLEHIAPEIRKLNSQYRNLATLTDDIEDSIIKSGGFESSKGVDAAEFAQTNLRRLFSDAQSAADYRAIYDEMDAISRKLGYSGARADDLAAFAIEMRKLFDSSVPATSFQGGIRGAISTVLKAGAPNTDDQIKALNEIINTRLSPPTE